MRQQCRNTSMLVGVFLPDVLEENFLILRLWMPDASALLKGMGGTLFNKLHMYPLSFKRTHCVLLKCMLCMCALQWRTPQSATARRPARLLAEQHRCRHGWRASSAWGLIGIARKGWGIWTAPSAFPPRRPCAGGWRSGASLFRLLLAARLKLL